MTPRLLVKHVAGSKANRIEHFPINGTDELTIGRSHAADIRFDASLDDTVSRKHAVLKIRRAGGLCFDIADLGSKNGVRINGEPISGEQALLLDELVELSPGGPAFRIAVEPELLCAGEAGAEVAPKGGDTVGGDGKVSAEAPLPRKDRRRYLVLALFLALTAALGASTHGSDTLSGWRRDIARAMRSAATTQAAPASAVAVADATARLASSTVYLEARWRLYDTYTGKPVFQKTLTRRGQRLPCFVELGDHRVVPWLTTEDEEHTNLPVGGITRGVGVVVSAQGDIITDERVAAGWTAPYRGAETAPSGALFRAQSNAVREAPIAVGDLGARLGVWVPGTVGFLFRSRNPVLLAAGESRLEGRNEVLNVRLPRRRAAVPAHILRLSREAGLAELKADAGRPLPAVELARDADLSIGRRLTTFAYPASLRRPSAAPISGNDGLDDDATDLPDLALADGSLAGTDQSVSAQGNGTASKRVDGRYTLAGPAARGAAGSPVFDSDGRVLAVLGWDESGVYAYPVRIVRAWLQTP
jgi:serine protease Do